jgi:hypothetical protein
MGRKYRRDANAQGLRSPGPLLKKHFRHSFKYTRLGRERESSKKL